MKKKYSKVGGTYMKKFQIEIEEISQRVEDIEANNLEEALEKVEDKYGMLKFLAISIPSILAIPLAISKKKKKSAYI